MNNTTQAGPVGEHMWAVCQ